MKEVKLMKKANAWLQAWKKRRKEKMIERCSEELTQEAKRLLQVREFGGNLYVCYDNIPLMSDKLLNADLAQAVEEIRNIYIKYRKSNGVWHRK